jgi:hypothetical protein
MIRALLSLVLLAACGGPAERIVPRLVYFRDARTGLCFAVHGGDYRLFTWVPCAAVENLIGAAP